MSYDFTAGSSYVYVAVDVPVIVSHVSTPTSTFLASCLSIAFHVFCAHAQLKNKDADAPMQLRMLEKIRNMLLLGMVPVSVTEGQSPESKRAVQDYR